MSFACAKCNLKFGFQYELIVHGYSHRINENRSGGIFVLSPVDDEKHKCGICKREFVYRSCYLQHVQSCVPKYNCVLCNKILHSVLCLTDHIRLHTRECPYKCDVCSKLFLRKDQFILHGKRHNEESKENKEKASSNRKEKLEDSKDHKKKFECLQCPKKFTRNAHLQMHIRSHTGELSNECEWCGQQFLRPDHLQRHQVIHKWSSIDERCSCAVCGERWSTYLLKTHMKVRYDGKMPFVCEKCNKSFKTKGNLCFHGRAHEVN